MVQATQIREHMEVVAPDGRHVGVVDSVEGDRIKLTRTDPAAAGQHRFVPLSQVDFVGANVRLKVPLAESQSGPGLPEGMVGQAAEALQNAAKSASETAREAYDQGQRYVREATDRYPEAERYYREGTRVARRYASESPVVTLLVGIGLGYVLAKLIDLVSDAREEDVPDYARTRDSFPRH
jgi:hypothetical protein